jgi:hypothetical protein
MNWRRIWTKRGRRTRKAVLFETLKKRGKIGSEERRNARRTSERRKRLRGERRIGSDMSRTKSGGIKRGRSQSSRKDSNRKRKRSRTAAKRDLLWRVKEDNENVKENENARSAGGTKETKKKKPT